MPESAETPLPRFKPPKQWIRWIAVVLAVVGWRVSLHSFQVSSLQTVNDPLMRLVCAGGQEGQEADGCTAVLTSPQAYLPLSRNPGAPKIPLGALGMTYFAGLLLWFLFVGPPTYGGRWWHVLPLVLVLFGAGYSAYYIHVMANVLHRWCGSCLAAHTVNVCLIVTTVLAWPRQRPAQAEWPHPTGRLALATVLGGVAVGLLHLAMVLVGLSNGILERYQKEVAGFLKDAAFIRWEFARQPEVSLPLRDDELFAGDPNAPNTLVVFSDFQCPACRQSHETLMEVAQKHPQQLRVAFRYFPQDPACNPEPAFRVGGHASGCRAAQAAEAARIVGGRDGYLAMRKTLWDRQGELPQVPLDQQTQQQQLLFRNWAAEIGLEPAAFDTAMNSAAVADHIRKDVELGARLKLQALPALFLNGRRIVHWNRVDIWDALLSPAAAESEPAAATQPAGSGD